MDLGFCRSYWLATFAPCENPLYGQNTSRTPGYVPEVCSRLALELQRAPTAFRTRGRWSVASQPRKLLPFATVEQPTGSRSLESLQKTRYATSRNPRNGAAILAVPRLNLLCSISLRDTARPLGDTGAGLKTMRRTCWRGSVTSVCVTLRNSKCVRIDYREPSSHARRM